MFYLVMSACLLVAASYVGWRTLWPSRMHRGLKLLFAAALFCLGAMPAIIAQLQWFYAGAFHHDLFYWGMYCALGYMTMLTLAQAAWDTTLLARAGLRRALPSPAVSTHSRRGFFSDAANATVFGTSVLLTGVGTAQAWSTPEVVRVDIPIPTLPPAFDGFTIAHLTDIHVGPIIKREACAAVVAQCNALGAEMIAVTGDVVDGYVPALEGDMAPLGNLAAPHGVYFVTGNHEYYSGALRWIELLREMGHSVLENEHVMLERAASPAGSGAGGVARLCVAGVHDIQGGHYVLDHWPRPEAALRGAARRDATIMLAHFPGLIRETSPHGVDLQLSGHTHGGQYFPGNLLAGITQGYVAGLYRHERSWLYVNRGAGTWGPPIRLGIPPEITLLTLRRASV